MAPTSANKAATTISQGLVVWHRGELRTVRGAGRYIDRPCFPPAVEALGLLRAAARPVGVKRA